MGSAVAFALAPTLALAYGGAEGADQTPHAQQGYPQAQQGTEAAQGQEQRVNEHFTRAVADRCVYEGTLEGTLRQHPEHAALEGARYDANLTLRGTAHCPDGRRATVEPVALNGQNLPGSKIEDWAAVNGRVKFIRAGRVCSISPSFALRGESLTANPTFRELCITARGGGPGMQDRTGGSMDTNYPR
jgi:hypothetical protein